jgi:hypothetical protein
VSDTSIETRAATAFFAAVQDKVRDLEAERAALAERERRNDDEIALCRKYDLPYPPTPPAGCARGGREWPDHVAARLADLERAVAVTRQRVKARAPRNELDWLRDVGTDAATDLRDVRTLYAPFVGDEQWEQANDLYDELLALTGAMADT